MCVSVFFLSLAMSQGTCSSRSSPMPRPLGECLASANESLVGGLGTLDSQCDSDVIVTEQPHGEVAHEPGDSFSASQQENLEGVGLQGPTALDSDDGSATQQYMKLPVDIDGYDFPEGEQADGPAATLLDTGFGSDDHDQGIDWLLHLGDDASAGRSLCTEQLGTDVQTDSNHVRNALPGFGIDSCKWALDTSQPKFFWETDPFLSGIFGQSDLLGPDLKRPADAIDLTSGSDPDVMALLQKPKQNKVAGFCEQVIKHVELRDEASKRHSIVSNWTSLVCINIGAFSVGDAILAGGSKVTHADVEQSLRACFARKATSTLSKRFYAMNRFVNYCGQRGLQFFPLREHVVFTYLQSLVQDDRTAASAGKTFLEACRFAKGVLGLRSDLLELGTARVDGIAAELSMRAGPIVQAVPLQVSQVIALEKLVASTPDMKDRALFGAMLLLLYGCGRFSDGQRAVNMILDVDVDGIDPQSLDCSGYLELQVLGNKGARSDVLRRTFLPVVAPIYSLASVEWFRAWLQARTALGLDVSGKLQAPLLCRFGIDGKPLQQEVTSSECGRLLRKALRVEGDGNSGIKSHSLKATALSWAGKHGMDLESRRLLGHHLDANAKSAEAYNRDSMGPAVGKLVNTLKAIKQGLFLPDANRSGRFVNQGAPDQTGADLATEELSDSDSSFVPSSSDSSDSGDDVFAGPSDSTLLWHLVVPELRPGFLDVPDDCTVFRNNVSGMQHLKLNGNVKFLCGRRECDRYTYFAGKPVKGVAMCEHCLHSKDLVMRDEAHREDPA